MESYVLQFISLTPDSLSLAYSCGVASSPLSLPVLFIHQFDWPSVSQIHFNPFLFLLNDLLKKRVFFSSLHAGITHKNSTVQMFDQVISAYYYIIKLVRCNFRLHTICNVCQKLCQRENESRNIYCRRRLLIHFRNFFAGELSVPAVNFHVPLSRRSSPDHLFPFESNAVVSGWRWSS